MWRRSEKQTIMSSPSTSRVAIRGAKLVPQTPIAHGAPVTLKRCALTFQWKIDKFSQLKQVTGECLESPEFSTPSVNGDILWRMQMYPRGIEREYKNFVAVYLHCVSSNVNIINLKYRFTVVKANGEVFDPLDPMGFRHTQPNLDAYNYFSTFTREESSWGCTEFLRHDEVFSVPHSMLKKDKLILRCQIDINNLTFPSEKPSGEQKPNEMKTLSDCLGEQFLEQTTGDVRVNVGEAGEGEGQTFLVHKNILTCRSPVFKAMFEHETEERSQNAIEIQGMEPVVVREMLYFMHTDEVKNMELHAKGLYEAADKYDIDLLKSKCLQYLSDTISVENAAELLIFADFNNIKPLKEKALRFVNDQASSVIKTAGWTKLAREAPYLAVDAYQHLVEKMKDSQ